MQTISTSDITIHIRDDGPRDGRAVMFGNSLGTDLRVWDALLPLLPPGLRIIRFDKRGHEFLVRLAGPLAETFGVCANANANSDGRVVSLDHGCGAHSEVQMPRRNLPAPLPDPVVDEITLEDLESF